MKMNKKIHKMLNALLLMTMVAASISFPSLTVKAADGKDGTLNITQDNVQLAYYNWQKSSTPTSSVTLNEIPKSATSQTISNYVNPSDSSTGTGYVVVFVKADENCLFTGLGASGAGQCFAVKNVTDDDPFDANDYLVNGSGIGNYPGLKYVVKAAYDAGYKAVFGWQRAYNASSLSLSFTTLASTPTMGLNVGLTAEDAAKTDVKPGDVLNFDVTVTANSVTNSSVKSVTITDINGQKMEITPEASSVDDSGFGTYKTTIQYTITQADFEAGKVVMDVSAKVKYACSLGMSKGTVETESEITESATATANPGPHFAGKANATYTFESATSGKSLPDSVESLKPADKVIPVGTEYSATQPTSTKVDATDGYWVFKGYDKDSATPSTEGETVTFTGTWEFVDATMSIITPSANDSTKVYDGISLAPEASANVEGAKITYSTTYDEDAKEWTDYKETVAGLTDAGTLKVSVKAEKSGYESATAEYTLEVTPRPVTFTGESGSKTYTGSEIELTNVTQNAGTDEGLVMGHTSNVVASAKGTAVGTYPGTITAADDVTITTADGKTDVTKNYEITTEAGELTITAKSDSADDNDANDAEDTDDTDTSVISTGDSSNIILWTVIVVIALSAFAAVVYLRKRK